jgi:hypothetical protein
VSAATSAASQHQEKFLLRPCTLYSPTQKGEENNLGRERKGGQVEMGEEMGWGWGEESKRVRNLNGGV